MKITTLDEAIAFIEAAAEEDGVDISDLPTAEAYADAKNHTHEWRMTWGLAYNDVRTGELPTWWKRFKHTGRHLPGQAKGANFTNGNWMGQWRAYQKWLPKHLRRLASEALRMQKAIESFGGTKLAWL